ncbi:hypothetical protein Ga0609869_000607 [Rhodovulum iodosum]|uniref:DUF1194 domain-containing protein n=1 Tax=Rhodovulum iodosum TaxID=68291 RepID=A0ABV3XPW7_9RHOB|nr:DUF1194 domain-containing protein [Rhodovulum robiginosum]RSK31624.1 DUF1194 domain-containing protein [Rhodovulum robiginosum]
MMRLLAALLLAATPLCAQDVELELVLLADASGSIDMDEIRFQREGYAEAITDPAVLAAIANTAYGKIAVTYVEWASAGEEDVVVPWTVIAGEADAAAFAAALIPPPRMAFGRNAIGSALLTGKALIEGNEIEGWRKVIDFSGDSANNWNGPSIEEARAEVLAAGITINGLPILCRFCNGRPSGADLERLYSERIIGGMGAFVVTADSEESFADAVRRKLILEISGQMPGEKVAVAD